MPGEAQLERAQLERAAAGDRAAFRALVEAYRGPVFRFVERMTRNRATAEDVLQETFLSLLEHAADFRGEGSPRGWVFSIARNHVRRQLRRRAGEPESHEPLTALGVAAGYDAPLDPETLTRMVEDRRRLERALGALEDADREVLLLRDVEELSGEETAAALQLSLAAMKSRLHRARLRLAAELRKGGFDGGS